MHTDFFRKFSDWLEHADGNGAHAIPAGMPEDASSKKGRGVFRNPSEMSSRRADEFAREYGKDVG